jgi:hypothetical protein
LRCIKIARLGRNLLEFAPAAASHADSFTQGRRILISMWSNSPPASAHAAVQLKCSRPHKKITAAQSVRLLSEQQELKTGDYGLALVGRHAVPNSPSVGVRHVVATVRHHVLPNGSGIGIMRLRHMSRTPCAKPVDASSIAATIVARTLPDIFTSVMVWFVKNNCPSFRGRDGCRHY